METATKTQWHLDLSHSELTFKVKHLMISNVKGSFRKFEALVDGEDIAHSTAHVKVDAASIFTNDDNRDGHLRAPDFFDTENHPVISFESTGCVKGEGGHYKMNGNLTIKGTTKSITLDVTHGGTNKDPWGNEKAAFEFNTKINRKDWGLNWNAALETGGVLVSDEVAIHGEVQFVKKSA